LASGLVEPKVIWWSNDLVTCYYVIGWSSVVPVPDRWSPIRQDYENIFGSSAGLDIIFAQAGFGLSKTV